MHFNKLQHVGIISPSLCLEASNEHRTEVVEPATNCVSFRLGLWHAVRNTVESYEVDDFVVRAANYQFRDA